MSTPFRLKICFVSPTLYPLFNPIVRAPWNEGDLQMYELARWYGGAENSDTCVITGDFGQEEVEFYAGVLVYRCAFQPPSSGWLKRFMKRETHPLVEKLKQAGAQIVFMSGASSLCHEVAEFCQKYRRAFFYRVTHQRECDRTFIEASGEAGEKFRWALRHATMVFCQTQEQKTMLKRFEQINSEVIPNLIPIAPLSEAPRRDVLWIGPATPWKQPELFLRLALTLPAHLFTMMSWPEDADSFEKLVSSTRDIPNLGFQNLVPYHEYAPFLARARLLVNTSRVEGFPFAWTAALAQGIPVISLNAHPDAVLEREQIGLYAQGSETRLAESVHDLMTIERQWKRLSDNAYQYALLHSNLSLGQKAYRPLFLKACKPAGR